MLPTQNERNQKKGWPQILQNIHFLKNKFFLNKCIINIQTVNEFLAAMINSINSFH